MIVIVKNPSQPPKICEANGISEINKLVGNIDENGNGYAHGGTDIRMSIGKGVDMYVKEDAINNFSLEQNLWTPGDNAVLFGTIVFAGYDQNSDEECGACSLTEEQIEYCKDFIAKQEV